MWITGQIIHDLKKFGVHGNVCLRSDQEPAITALLDEVRRARPGTRKLAERLLADELGERAVRSIEEMIRVHKGSTEWRLGIGLLVMHFAFSWLVDRCVHVLNKAVVGWMDKRLGNVSIGGRIVVRCLSL